jgi:putative ABC transport system substrate-binding protein
LRTRSSQSGCGGSVCSCNTPRVIRKDESAFGISEKWLDLLQQVVPRVTRVAVLRDTTSPTGIGQLGALQSAARSFNVELTPIGVHDAEEIERGIKAFASGGKGSLIVTPSTSAFRYAMNV